MATVPSVLSLLTGWMLQLAMVQGAACSEPICGRPKIKIPRIVGGEAALNGSWPWQVSIFRGGRPLCGGSLLTEEWVLSAAHCFYGSIATYQYDVLLGAHQLSKPTQTVVEAKVKLIIPHPDYNGHSGDIALLKLASPVEFNNYILPVCLPDSSLKFPPNSDCWVTGWGTIREGAVMPVLNTLQELKVWLINRTACNTLYNVNPNITKGKDLIDPDMICAGYEEGGKDACQGDSGGPLVCKLEGGWTQAGVVSWGIGCARKSYPGVYASVTYYANWINETMTANGAGKNGGLHSTSAVIFLLLSFTLALL